MMIACQACEDHSRTLRPIPALESFHKLTAVKSNFTSGFSQKQIKLLFMKVELLSPSTV